jgi:hypothetical protein
MEVWFSLCIAISSAILGNWLRLPTAPVRRVCRAVLGAAERAYIYIYPRRFYTASTATYYLTRSQGRTNILTRQQRLLNWKQAVRYITVLLRTRKKWAATGLYLQQSRIQDLVFGLQRLKGILKRKSAAAFSRDAIRRA